MALDKLEDFERLYEDMIGYMPDRIRERVKLGLTVDPDILRDVETVRINALTPDCIDQKHVQLMCFAILLTQGSAAALNHARAAIKVGATKEELHASAAIAFVFRGVAAFNLAGETINKAFEVGGK